MRTPSAGGVGLSRPACESSRDAKPAVRAPALPQPLQPPRRREQGPRPGPACQGAGHAGGGPDRSRQPVRRRRVPPRGQRRPASSRSWAWRRTSPRGVGPSARRRRLSGQEHAFHLTLLARNGEGVRNLMRLSSSSVPRRLLLQAPDRQGDPRTPFRRADLPLGLRLRRVLRPHPPRQDRRGREALRLVSEGLRRGELLRRDPGQRRRRSSTIAPRAPSTSPERMGLPLVGHQRRPLPHPRGRRRPRRPALHQHRQDARRPEPDAVRHRGVLSSAVPDEMYAAMPGHDEALARSRPRSPSSSSRTTRASAWASAVSPRSSPPDGKTPEDYLRELCEAGPPRSLRR